MTYIIPIWYCRYSHYDWSSIIDSWWQVGEGEFAVLTRIVLICILFCYPPVMFNRCCAGFYSIAFESFIRFPWWPFFAWFSFAYCNWHLIEKKNFRSICLIFCHFTSFFSLKTHLHIVITLDKKRKECFLSSDSSFSIILLSVGTGR